MTDWRSCAVHVRGPVRGAGRRDRADRLLPGRRPRRASRPRSPGSRWCPSWSTTSRRSTATRSAGTSPWSSLTPTRLVLCHTDEHAPDDLLPQPYTSTSTEAIPLDQVRSVVVNRMVANPASDRGADAVPAPAEAVLTVGWGGVNRIDLEPATLRRPAVRGRPRLHRRARLRRLLAAAELGRRRAGGGRPAAGLRRDLSAHPGLTRARRPVTPDGASSSRRTAAARSGDVLPAVARALGVDVGFHATTLELPARPALRRAARRRPRAPAARRPRRPRAVPARAAAASPAWPGCRRPRRPA